MGFECSMTLLGENLKKWTYRSEKEHGSTTGIAVYPGVFIRRHSLEIKNLPDGNTNGVPYLKLNYCLTGRCEVTLPEERYTYLEKGSASISVDCGGTSFFYPSGKYSGLEIAFDLHQMEEAEPSVFQDLGVSPGKIRDLLEERAGCLTGTVRDSWQEEAETLYALLSDPDNCTIEELRYRLLTLWYKINTGDLIADSRQKYLSKGQRKLAKDIEAILTADLTRTVSIAELAQCFDLSPASLEKYFTGLYGCSINEYLRMVRMDRAAELLRETTMKVLDIAQETGYRSQSKFGTVFKRHTGLSPLEYRRQKKEVKTDVI